MNLLKEKWDEVEFGQVVDHIENNERDPEKRLNAKYVGVKHIHTLDLRIKGISDEEMPTYTRKFKKGQILFAKRRAYQKKVAVADFDGICSPHLWALETKGELSQDLLPFIMQRDEFYEYVNANSAGTMSSYIKWPALSRYKFRLPTFSDQKKITNLLTHLEDQIIITEKQTNALLGTKMKLLNAIFIDQRIGTYLNSSNYIDLKFGDLAYFISDRVEPSKSNLKIFIGLEHIDPDWLRIDRYDSPKDLKGTKLLAKKNDIIFGKRNAYLRKVAVSHMDCVCSAHAMVLRPKEENIDKDFLPYLMQSDMFMERAKMISEGSISPTIKWKNLEKQEFFLPKKEYQKRLTSLFLSFDNQIVKTRNQVENLKNLKMKLLTEIFD